MIAGILALLALTATAGVAEANVLNSCTTYCHGLPPRDGVRKANPHFDSQSSAFSGNHRTHLPAASVAASCSVCHAPVSPTGFGHQNGVINMANSLKWYSSASIRAKYDRGLFFNQTSIPNLATATCSNVSCHFEAKSPAWNLAPLVYPTGCSVCHGAPPSGGATGASGSHARHDAYFPGATGCQKCHPDYSTFSHATSAGRSLLVRGYLRDPANNLEAAGTYSGSGSNYFPSQSASQVFGTCNTIYCHSSGQGATGTGALAYQSVNWGGAPLNCGSCHQNMAADSAATGSHQLHATVTTSTNGAGVNFTCQVCHGLSYSRSKTPVGLGGSHVNKNIELSFTTISGANAAGTIYSKSASFAPGTAYGQCSSSACHGSGKPFWGANTTRPECFKCHGSTVAAFTTVSAASVAPGFNGEGRDTGGNTVATAPRVGAHQTHLTAADNISSPIHCGECHTTHRSVKDATHLNFTTATITFGPLARTASHSPAVSRTAGVISCSNTYCHNGNRTGATASSTTPVFTSATLIGNTTITDTCIAKCHGMPPGGGVAGDTHAGLSASGSYTTPASLTACSSQAGGGGCHPTLTGAPTSMATIFFDKTKHINCTVEAAGGHAFPYGGSVHRPGGTGSPLANAAAPYTNCTTCHDATTVSGTYPVARGTKPLCSACHKNMANFTGATPGCWDCHGSSATNGQPNGNTFPNISANHTVHMALTTATCNTCHSGFGTGSSRHGFSNTSTSSYPIKKVGFSGVGTAPIWTQGAKTCAATNCHGQGVPVWGSRAGAPVNGFPYSAVQCEKCHGATTSNPFYSTAIPKVSVNTDVKVGAHFMHLTSSTIKLTRTMHCNDCHAMPATVTAATHMNGITDLVWSALATHNGALVPAYNATTRQCSNVYCHGAAMPGGDVSGTNRTPTWNVPFLPSTISAAGCGTCHGFPPLSTSGHPTLTTAVPATWGNGTTAIGTSCSCHANINPAGTTYANIFVNPALHIDGTLQVSGGHAVPFDNHSTPGRTVANCIICHAQGTSASVYPAPVTGNPPDCQSCHKKAAPSTTTGAGRTACISCHGTVSTGANRGRPTGASFPDRLGYHSGAQNGAHGSAACSVCHNGLGTSGGSGSGVNHGRGSTTGPVRDGKPNLVGPMVNGITPTNGPKGASSTSQTCAHGTINSSCSGGGTQTGW